MIELIVALLGMMISLGVYSVTNALERIATALEKMAGKE